MAEISEDEIPFDIPKSWKWVRIPEIGTSSLGKTLNKSIDAGKEVPYLCSINVYWEGINLDQVKTAKFSALDMENIYCKEDPCLSVKAEMWDEVQFGIATRRCTIKMHCIVLDFWEE